MEKNKNSNISDSEMKVMEKIWESKKMVPIAEIVAELKEDGEEWTYKTVATFLIRLEEKGYVSSTKTKNRRSYFPLVSKEDYNREEAENIIKRRFGGSLKNFLASFSSSRDLSSDEIEDLREWLDKKDG